MKQALNLTFPQNLIREPVIYKMVKKYEVIFNVRRAKVTDKLGEIVLELEGDPAELAEAVAWLKNQSIKVEPITRDTLES